MWQEDQARSVLPGGWQGGRCARPEEFVGHLNDDAGAIARVLLASARAAMFQVDEDLQRFLDDIVGAPSFDVHNEADTARVVFGVGVVQTLSGRWRAHSPI